MVGSVMVGSVTSVAGSVVAGNVSDHINYVHH